MKYKKQRNCFKQLNLNNRIQIEIKYNQGKSLAQIAEYLGKKRNKSTICREIDGAPRKGKGGYNAYQAHCRALTRVKDRGKRERLKNEATRAYAKEKLKIGWSPEQVSIRIGIDMGKDYAISPEAIYQFIYAQVHRGGNGVVKKECEDLRPYLARRHVRRQQKGFRQTRKMYRPELPSIDDRPKVVGKRKELGHWEDDCIVSRESTVRLKTMNERVSGIILIRKMKDGTIQESNRAVASCMNTVPSLWRKTLTRDRGTENMGYKEIEKEFGMQCFFAHAYCSQERGSNENGNGLIRRPYPKKTDFALITDEAISNLEYLLNSRPRKRLGGKTPYEVFYEHTGVALKC